MKPTLIIVLCAGAAAASLIALATVAGQRTAGSPTVPTAAERLEHGRYFVHRVALCIDCHSPRNAQGEFEESNHLTGASLPFAPTVPMPWASAAPGIAGLPAGYTEDELVRFLMTGDRPHGRPPSLPPMPSYRLNQSDAEAVASYLRSLRRDE